MMKFELKENSFVNIAYEALKTSLSNCSTFQELCGVDTETKAEKRIYIDTFALEPLFGGSYTKGEVDRILPCAVICTSGYGSNFGRSMAGVGTFHSTGRLAVQIYITVPDEYIDKYSITPMGVRIVESIIGEIVKEMENKTKDYTKQYFVFESSRISSVDINSSESQATIGAVCAVQLEFDY